MSTSTVRSPGRSARSSREAMPTPPDESPPTDPSPRPRRIDFQPERRGWRTPQDRRFGVALSLGLHVVLLLVLLVTDLVRLPDFASLLDGPEDAPSAAGGSVVLLSIDDFPMPRTSAAPSSPTIAAAARPPVTPAPAAGIAAPGAADASVAAPPSGGLPAAEAGGTPARDRFHRAIEALRPRLLDPRLRPGNAADLRTPEEIATARVYARINELNDSILAEIEAGRRATDWTWTDENGRRWGVSPGKLHLGGIEIPLPLTFAPSAEQRERIREWEEIQAQAEQGAIDETFDDRVEAIREQRDAERAEE